MKTAGLFAATLIFIGTCQATAVLGNLPGQTPYNGDAAPLGSALWVAAGVTTGSTAVVFTSLEGEFSSSGSASLNGWIYSDASGTPGSIIAAFNSENINGAAESSGAFTATDDISAPATGVTFTTAGTFDLQANTSYWFVIDPSPNVSWLSDSSHSGAGAAPLVENSSGFSFAGYDSTSNSGGNWTTLLTSEGNPTIELDATPVPEPAGIFLISCGCACLILSRRLRRA